MTEKYLNETGLAHLWAKLKEKLTAKQDALSGAEGQLVGFDADGQPTAQDIRLGSRNLLDNWYFADPVDQINGYVLPPGSTVYASVWANPHTTTKYLPVTKIDHSANYAEVNEDGTTYYIGAAECVRGYVSEPYTLDRWRAVFGGNAYTVNDGYSTVFYASAIATTHAQIAQTLETPKDLIGKQLTLSMKYRVRNHGSGKCAAHVGCVKNDVGRYLAVLHLEDDDEWHVKSVTFTVPEGTTHVEVCIGTKDGKYTDMTEAWTRPTADTYLDIEAVKLEIGTCQTLAHRTASGDWELNDAPPHKQQELAKCQRYQDVRRMIRLPANTSMWVPFHQQMRTVPVVTFEYNEDSLFEIMGGTVTKDGFLIKNTDTNWARSFSYLADANV